MREDSCQWKKINHMTNNTRAQLLLRWLRNVA